MARIVFIGADAKARQLATAVRDCGGDAKALQVYPFTAWKVLATGRHVARGDVIVARFLNDHPWFVVSLLKVAGDALTLSVCALRGVRVFWLCHNVDRETENYWPMTSRLRRELWSRRAERIVIDDPSLMDAANAVYHRQRGKLFAITLGPLNEGPIWNRPDLAAQGRAFLARPVGDGNEAARRLHILVAGTSGEKYLHFDLLPVLERRLRDLGWAPRILVITRFQRRNGWSRGKHYREFIDWCDRTPSVLLLRDYIDLDEREWKGDVDLIWRTLADWSFPFTLFNAARAGIPVLSYQCGHTGQLVEREGIGAMVRWDFANLAEAVDRALATPQANFDAFLAQRSWENGARRLVALTESAGASDLQAAKRAVES